MFENLKFLVVGAGFSGGVDSIHADVGIKPQEKYFTGNARGRFLTLCL